MGSRAFAPASSASRLLSVLFAAAFAASVSAAKAPDASALWASRVRRVLDAHCLKCHGPMERKGGLDLDSPESILKGGDDGPVLVAGQPGKSAMFLNLAPGADPHMPPKKQLGDADREAIRAWIAAMKPAPKGPARPAAARAFKDVPSAIDALVAEGWKARGVKPAKALDDRAWCRRVHLDLVGRIPTPAETDAFLRAPSGTRRAALADRLLASGEHAVHMRELWDVFLMGRPKRDNHEDRRRQNGWHAFLEDAFARNRPWDEVVRDLLVARPSDPDAPASKGSAWFLYERRNEHQQIAEAVAPLVYGARIDCAQCHDHPLSRDIKQAHYWGLVAAFNRGKNVEGTTAVAESAVGGFVNFTNLKKESQPALVALLGGPTLEEARPAAGAKEEDRDDLYVDPKAKARVPRYSRRAAFAEAATRGNPRLARAFVNRMWSVLEGRGIVHPADEMNARNAPSHPELLDWLASDFESHRYDVRRLVRGIVLSRVYGLGPSPAGSPPEAFAGALERPLTAEQLARSWRVAAGLAPDDDALRRATAAAMPDVLPRDYNATFQQAQFLCNAPALAAVLRPEAGGTVKRLASEATPEARVRAAFAAALGRAPAPDEMREARALASTYGDPAASARDLMWSLLASPEFLTMP